MLSFGACAGVLFALVLGQVHVNVLIDPCREA